MSVYSPTVPIQPIQHKVWGQTQTIFLNDKVEVAVISLNKGGYCSIHYHEDKPNRFHVIRGRVLIEVFRHFKEDGSGPDDTKSEKVIITNGMTIDVPEMVCHRMTALEDSEMIEIYWGEDIHPSDIVRFSNGGNT